MSWPRLPNSKKPTHMTIFDKNAFDLAMILLVTFWFIPFGAFMALLQRLFPDGSSESQVLQRGHDRRKSRHVNGMVLGYPFG